MTQASLGYGTRFYMQEIPASTSLSKLAEVTSAPPPSGARAKQEATHYESPGETREYILGLIDPGSLSLTLNHIPGSDTDDTLAQAYADGLARTMRVVLPGVAPASKMFTFTGAVANYEIANPIDDRMTSTVTIELLGAVVREDTTADPTVISGS